jgi:hypothetical protein
VLQGTVRKNDRFAHNAMQLASILHNNIATMPCLSKLPAKASGLYTPGHYCFNMGAEITGPFILDGLDQPGATFTFYVPTFLDIKDDIVLRGGAKACNVLWSIGASGTRSRFFFPPGF